MIDEAPEVALRIPFDGTAETRATLVPGSPARPIAENMTSRPAESAVQDAAPPARVALVVDPEPSVRGLLSALLRREGWDVIDARDPAECAARLNGHSPGLLLIDPIPWERSEADLIARIRSRDPHASIVVVSEDPEAISIARELGAKFMPKPFAIHDFAMFVGSSSGMDSNPAFVGPRPLPTPESSHSHGQAPETTADALKAWRAAERRLDAAAEGSPQRPQLEAEVRDLRRAYQEVVALKSRRRPARI